MASQQVNTTILRSPNDWENWYHDLQSAIWPEIWEILNPEGPEKSTLSRPEKPTFAEYHTGAERYSDLSQSEQKSFMNAQHIYEVDLKGYTQQTQKIQDVRSKIQLLVSDVKKALLLINKSTREWLRILIDGTKPNAAMAQQAAELRYRNAIIPLRTTASKVVLPWIEEWETAMAEGIRAELPHALNTQAWMRDFCAAIRGIAESVATSYELKLSEGIQVLSFQAVGSAFRSWYCTRYPSSMTHRVTIRGSAFETSFAGENANPEREEADTTNQGASSAENSRKRQRAPTSATNDRQKAKRARCKACDRPHDISRCWLAVEASRPPGWKPSQKAVDDFKKRLQKQKSLAELVEKARAEYQDQA